MYERSHEFTADEGGLCNARLAYYITSEKLEELYDNISQTSIEEYAGLDLKGLLAIHLSKSPDHFDIDAAVNVDEGVLQFHIPVLMDMVGYDAEENQVTFTRFPDIRHGVFHGINTGSLEDQMERINWKKDELFFLNEQDDVVLLPHVRAINDAVNKLSEHEESRMIADYLKVKYWPDSVMEMYVEDDTWKMKDWQRVTQRFVLEDDCKTIANLLRGKPVHTTQIRSIQTDKDGWLIIDPDSVTAEGLNSTNLVQGLARAQLETMVNMLPLDGTMYVGDIVRSIAQGEQVPLNLIGVEGQQQVIVAANPKEQNLDLLSADGKAIPFNFRLDPDWQPEHPQQLETKPDKARALKNQPIKRIKGIGKSPKR